MDNTNPEDLVRFLCSCGKKLKVSRKFLGKFGKCPKCGQEIKIPEDKLLLPSPISSPGLRAVNIQKETDVAPLPPLDETNESVPMDNEFTEEIKDINDTTSGATPVLPNLERRKDGIPVTGRKVANFESPLATHRAPVTKGANPPKGASPITKIASKLIAKEPPKPKSEAYSGDTKVSQRLSPSASPLLQFPSHVIPKEDPATLFRDSANITPPLPEPNNLGVVEQAFHDSADMQQDAIPTDEADHALNAEPADLEGFETKPPLAFFPEPTANQATESVTLDPENTPVIQTYEAGLPRALPVINPPIIRTISSPTPSPETKVTPPEPAGYPKPTPQAPPAAAPAVADASRSPKPVTPAIPEPTAPPKTLVTPPVEHIPAVTAAAPQPAEPSKNKTASELEPQYDSSHPEVLVFEELPEQEPGIDVKKLLADSHIKGGELLMQGKASLESTNFDEALYYLGQCINNNEDIGAAYFLRALLYIQKKALLLAIEDLRSSQDFEYRDMDVEDIRNRVLIQQATIYRNMGAYREATNLLKEIVSKDIDIEKAKVHWTKAKSLIQQGAATSAIHDLEEAIRLKYLRPEVFEARGRIYLEQGDYPSALHDFVSAITRGGKSASLYHARSEAYFFLKEYDSALNDIHTAQNLDPDNAIFYDFEALILNEKKQYEVSDVAFERSFGIEPDNPVHHFNRGLCYMRRGKYERAIDDFSKVIEANPKDRIAFFKRAICYQEKSNPNLALSREDFKKVELLEQGSMYRSTTPPKKRK